MRRRYSALFVPGRGQVRDLFLEGPEKFSHPESLSKISKLMITELFYSRILNVNRGSLYIRSFRRIKFPRLSRNGPQGAYTYKRPGALGPVSRKFSRARKAIAKSRTLRLQTCFIHIFLTWTEAPFIQEVSGAYTSPFLDTDELKMALRARKVSGAFETIARWNVCRPTNMVALEGVRTKSFFSFPLCDWLLGLLYN